MRPRRSNPTLGASGPRRGSGWRPASQAGPARGERALLAVGFDGHGKQLIVVWDISGLRSGHRAEVVVKHATDYHVRRAKFSPFEEDRLMTCGRDSIRIYRLKNGQLRGCSVNLGEHRTSKASTHGLAPGLMKEELTQNIFTDEGISFVSFTYRALWNGNPNSLEILVEEISEVQWFSVEEATAVAVSHFDRQALQSL